MEKNEGKGKTRAQTLSAATLTCLDAFAAPLHARIHKDDAEHDKANGEGRVGSMRSARVTFVFCSNLF